jgi:hypothetical protein
MMLYFIFNVYLTTLSAVKLLLALATTVIFGSESAGLTTIFFTVSDLRLPQTGGPVVCIHVPQVQGGPVISPFGAFYHSQGYSGGTKTRLHTGNNAKAADQDKLCLASRMRLFRIAGAARGKKVLVSPFKRTDYKTLSR